MSATILINLLKKNKNRVSMSDLRAAMVSEYGNAVADVQTRRSVDAARRAGAVLESVRDGRKVSALIAVGALPEIGANKKAGKTATPKVAKAKAAKIVKPKKVKVTRAMQKAVAAKVEKTDAEIAAIKAKNLETMKKVSKNITRFEDRLTKEVEELNKQSDDFEKLDLREFVPSYLLKEKYVE
jgi:hypothetical protein